MQKHQPLFDFEPPSSQEMVRDATLQNTRKISGFSKPPQVKEAEFHQAVAEIAAISARLLCSLESSVRQEDQQAEAAKAMARAPPDLRAERPAN